MATPTTCSFCGSAENGPGARFCANCGHPLPAPAPPRPVGGAFPRLSAVLRGSDDPGSGAVELAGASRAWAVAAPATALLAGLMSGLPALFGILGGDVGARTGLGGLPAILGPLLIWQWRQKDDPFAAQHALGALNFNLSVLAAAFALTVFGILTWGLGALLAVPAGLVLVLGWLVCSAVATARAWNGRPFRYPFSFPFVRAV